MLILSNRCTEREHAPFHSALVMCASRSQNAMQSCNDFPPPPAVLAAVSDGLEPEPDEDGSVSLRPLPPEVRVVVVTGGGSGVMPCSWGPGVPMTDVGTVV